MALIGRGQITLAVLHSGKDMQLHLNCNTPATQFFSLHTQKFSPDYAENPIQIFPELYFSGKKDDQIQHISGIEWFVNGVKPIEFGGVYLTHAPYTLTINKNIINTPQLKVDCRCWVTDPDTKLKVQVSATTTFTKQETENFTPSLLLETVDGVLFKNENPKTLTATCRLHVGAVEVEDKVSYVWYVLKNKEYVKLEDTAWAYGQDTKTLTVAYDYVKDQVTFKCDVTYNGIVYSEFVEFSSQSDPYILKIENKTGDKMKNGEGVIECEAHLYRGGEQIPDELADKLFDFKWKKFNKNTGQEDTSWRKPVARKISLTKQDVDRLSTFICEVDGKSHAFTYKLPLILT